MQKKSGETSWKRKTLAHSLPGARSWRSIHAVKSHMVTHEMEGTDLDRGGVRVRVRVRLRLRVRVRVREGG